MYCFIHLQGVEVLISPLAIGTVIILFHLTLLQTRGRTPTPVFPLRRLQRHLQLLFLSHQADISDAAIALAISSSMCSFSSCDSASA
jgi:hypothetical protein